MLIRKENTNDYNKVYNLVKQAFLTAENSDGNEHNLVNKLRESKSFVGELSLVAEEDGEVIGHILFTEVEVGDSLQLDLAPLSVLPEFQRRGIGKKLIEEGHKIAKNLGYSYSIVLGDPKYYGKMGYRPAGNFGIRPPFDVPAEYFMAIELAENPSKINGLVKYDPSFGIE